MSLTFNEAFFNETLKGPQYVDSASCICRLRTIPYEAWRCSGNQTEDVITTGKYFPPVDGSNQLNNDTDIWAGPKANTSIAYVVSGRNSRTLVPASSASESGTSLQDQVCTGQNDTTRSAVYYQEIADAANGIIPQLCWLPDALPLTIQDANSWNQTGCSLGFYCPNNTITMLPQFCPPLTICQEIRMSGGFCFPGMGQLEPSVCQDGFYCPKGGQQKLRCPAGHFCPVGTYEPIPCSILSRCPEGSVQNLTAWPLVLLIVLDLILLILTFAARAMWNRRRKSKQSVLKRTTAMIQNIQRKRAYSKLDDDKEAIAPPQIQMVSRSDRASTGLGFDAILLHEDESSEARLSRARSSTNKPTDLDRFIISLARCLEDEAANFGLSFEFNNLSFQPKKAPMPILSEVTGFIDNGSLWGVMGAPGAGKSTFANVLMGKTKNTGGVTRVNGMTAKFFKFKKLIGYVPQEDILLPELTVRENILHSARVRLPCTWKDVEIKEHVDTLISCLQLAHVKDSLVGSVVSPIISAGQRKRVSIGIELVANPMALFLDEPTSGLDATSAASVMKTLKAISRLGITVVVIVHQPRREILESLDSISLFADGKLIYQGKESEAQDYFEQLGYVFPERDNPADVIGDIITGQGQMYKTHGDTSFRSLTESWKELYQERIFKSGPTKEGTPRESLILHKTLKFRGAPWYKQVFYCFLRSMLQQFRQKGSLYAEISIAILSGLLVGLAELKQKGSNFRGIFNSPYELLSSSVDYVTIPQLALLVGVSIGLIASAPGVMVFSKEKLVYKREAEAGHNRFAYYIGKVLSTFPRMIFANLNFTVFFLLLATPRISFADAFIANMMYFYCIYGLASCVSMITRREDGPLIATVTGLVVSILNGASPSLATVRGWHMAWFWRAMPGTWLSEAYFTTNVVPWSYLFQVDDAASKVGYTLDQFHWDILFLLLLGTVYRIVAFGGLRIFN